MNLQKLRIAHLHNRPFYFLLIVLLALCTLTPVGAEEPVKPSFLVSTFTLGLTGGTLNSAEVIDKLKGDGWCTAAESPQAAQWNQKPESAPSNVWVSVVLTGFGEHADAFVFMFDGPGGTARLLAHVPYGMSWTPAVPKVWIPPTGQLASAFRHNYLQKSTPIPTRLISLKVTEWKNGAEETDSDNPLSGSALDSLAPIKTVSTVNVNQALPALSAMLCAAVCENGGAPQWNEAIQQLGMEIQFGFKTVSIRLTQKTGTGTTESHKNEIPEERCYGFLTRLIFVMTNDKNIYDFGSLGTSSLRLYATSPDRLLAQVDGTLAAYNPTTGKQIWPALTKKPAAPSAPLPYEIRPDANGIPQIFRSFSGVVLIDPATGKETSFAPETPSLPYRFATSLDAVTVVAKDNSLVAYKNGTVLWQKQEASPLTAGPSIQADRVFAGTAEGQLFCLALANGTEKWRKQGTGEWRGEIACSAEQILAFSKDGNTLTAMNSTTGDQLWKQSVGDVLLKTPMMAGGKWLVIGKNNRLLSLNPTDGKIVNDLLWPTWLVDVRHVASGSSGFVICTDIRNRLSILEMATFKPARELHLPAQLTGSILFAPQFPVKWGAAITEKDFTDAVLGESKPVILVNDLEGYFYIVPAP